MRVFYFTFVMILSTICYMNANQISRYEYWVNNQFSSRISEEIIDPTKSFELRDIFDLEDLASGVHTFNVRFKDSVGKWSVIHSSLFYKPYQSSPFADKSYQSNKIYGYRWWFDKDKNSMFEIKLRNPIERLNTNLNLQ